MEEAEGPSMAKGQYWDATVYLLGPAPLFINPLQATGFYPLFSCMHTYQFVSIQFLVITLLFKHQLCLVPCCAGACCWIHSVTLRWCSVPRAAAVPMRCRGTDHAQRVHSSTLSTMSTLPALAAPQHYSSCFIISKYNLWNTLIYSSPLCMFTVCTSGFNNNKMCVEDETVS